MKTLRFVRLGAISSILIAVTSLSAPAHSGPANSDLKLQFATASANNQNPHSQQQFGPDDVTLSNVKRGWTSVTWEADTPVGHLKCQADDMLHHFDCFPGKPTAAASSVPKGN